MKLRIFFVAVAALLLAQPGFADLRKYDLNGDQSTQFPTTGTVLRPGNGSTALPAFGTTATWTNSGTALIDDDNGGTSPVLRSLKMRNTFKTTVGGTLTSGIPGTTVDIDSRTDFGPTIPVAGKSGVGDVGTSISWGALTGWSQTGRLVCVTNCIGGCPVGVSSCVASMVSEGTGPPAPLVGGTFTFDPFTFSGSGASFSTPSVEIVNLVGGAVTAGYIIAGSRVFGSVPAIPLAALGGLGAGLVYLGSRALRRRKKD
jgi:hypothetical protein